MTIEEKAEKIKAYCKSMTGCSDCKLVNVKNKTCYDETFPGRNEERSGRYRKSRVV